MINRKDFGLSGTAREQRRCGAGRRCQDRDGYRCGEDLVRDLRRDSRCRSRLRAVCRVWVSGARHLRRLQRFTWTCWSSVSGRPLATRRLRTNRRAYGLNLHRGRIDEASQAAGLLAMVVIALGCQRTAGMIRRRHPMQMRRCTRFQKSGWGGGMGRKAPFLTFPETGGRTRW